MFGTWDRVFKAPYLKSKNKALINKVYVLKALTILGVIQLQVCRRVAYYLLYFWQVLGIPSLKNDFFLPTFMLMIYKSIPKHYCIN